MPKPKYLIDGEHAPPTKQTDQTSSTTNEDRLEAERIDEIESQAKSVRLATEDKLAKEKSSEYEAQENVTANLKRTIEREDLPVSLGGKPKTGSVGEKLIEKLEESEMWISTQRANLRVAGREMGENAQRAFEEGYYVEAALKGAAAFSARAGAGIIDASTILRPIALREMLSVVGATAVDVAQHPEKIPESVATTIKNVAQDPGSLVEFGFGLAGDYALGLGLSELGRQAGIVQTSVSRLDDLKISVDADSLKLIDEYSPISGKAYKSVITPDAEISGTISKRRIPREVAEIMTEELGDQSGSMKFLGVATEEGITAVDRINVPLSSSQFDDLMIGKTLKNIDDITIKRVGFGSEKVFSAIDLADEIRKMSDDTPTIFGKADDALAIDAKELGPSMNVFDEGTRTTTTIKTLEDLDTISLDDHMTGKTIELIKGEKRTVVIEETSGSIKISDLDETNFPKLDPNFIIDEVVEKGKKFTSEVDEGTRFGGPWGDEGNELILGEGDIRYDIKGQILKESVDDALDEIPRLEPQEGDPTPWAFTHKQPGYTDALRDLPDALKQDIDIIKELTGGEVDSPFFGIHEESPSLTLLDEITDGVSPVVKITEDPIKIDTKNLFVSRARGRGPPGQFGSSGAPPGLLTDYPTRKGAGTMPNPYFGKTEKAKKGKLTEDEKFDKLLRDREKWKEDQNRLNDNKLDDLFRDRAKWEAHQNRLTEGDDILEEIMQDRAKWLDALKRKEKTGSDSKDKTNSDDKLDEFMEDRARWEEDQKNKDRTKDITDEGTQQDQGDDQDDGTDEDDTVIPALDFKQKSDDAVIPTIDFKMRQKDIPIPIIIPKIIQDIIPKQPQKQTPDEPLDPTTPDFPELIYLTHKPRGKIRPQKKRRKSRSPVPFDPFGFEERKYGVLTPDEMLSLGKSKKSTKGLLLDSKSKKKRKGDLWL